MADRPVQEANDVSLGVGAGKHEEMSDLPDAQFRQTLSISGTPPESLSRKSIILSPSELESVVLNELHDEIQIVPGNGFPESADTLDDLSTIFKQAREIPIAINENTRRMLKNVLLTAPMYDPFTKRTMFFYVLSLLFDIFDYGSDASVAYVLKDEESTQWWFIFTVILILVPLVLLNMFSIFWFYQDHNAHEVNIRKTAVFGRASLSKLEKLSKLERTLVIVSHLFLIGPLYRHLVLMFCGFKERKEREKKIKNDKVNFHERVEGPYCVNYKLNTNLRSSSDYYTIRKHYERDTAYLGVVKAFLQNCPQLILQIYILVVRDHQNITTKPHLLFFQLASIISSLLSSSLSIVFFEQANRWANPDKPQMTISSILNQTLWRFFMVVSRVVTFALFATCFREELFIFMGLHWFLMTIWILLMGTNFCGTAENRPRPFSEFLYNVVMGFVGIFEYLHLKDGPTRIKLSFFYFLTFIEGVALMAMWYQQTTADVLEAGEELVPWSKETWYLWTSLSIVPSSFLLGLIFMITYYRFNHPGGRMPQKGQPASLF